MAKRDTKAPTTQPAEDMFGRPTSTKNEGAPGPSREAQGADKLPELLTHVLETIRDLEIKEDRFAIVKKKNIDYYRNVNLRKPMARATERLGWLTTETDVSLAEQATYSEGVDVDAMRHFKDEFLATFHVETYVHGNMDADNAIRLTSLVTDTLKPVTLSSVDWPVYRSLEFPPGSHYRFEQELFDPKEVNNGMVYWLHIADKDNAALRCRAKLLGQLISRVTFDWLRTKLQLGYAVSARYWPSYTASGLGVCLQRDHGIPFVQKCITAFLKTYAKWLAKMPDDDFESRKRNFVTKILKPPKSLYEAYSNCLGHIDSEYHDFGRGKHWCTPRL